MLHLLLINSRDKRWSIISHRTKTNEDHAPAVVQLSYQQAEHGFQQN